LCRKSLGEDGGIYECGLGYIFYPCKPSAEFFFRVRNVLLEIVSRELLRRLCGSVLWWCKLFFKDEVTIVETAVSQRDVFSESTVIMILAAIRL
jgi:hypothetical protein